MMNFFRCQCLETTRWITSPTISAPQKSKLRPCSSSWLLLGFVFFFQAEDGIRDVAVTGVQTCALPISAGRILNPKTARSQVIGAMTMGVGAALMEELAVDKRFGYFVNHDLAGYEEIGRASCRERV